MIPDVPDSTAFREETARTVRSAVLIVIGAVAIVAAMAAFVVAMGGCGAGLPSASDQAAVADYGLRRQECIDQAKAVKGDAADDGAAYWTIYVPCANRVDATFGMDAGGLR
jgi:hypothetical protein